MVNSVPLSELPVEISDVVAVGKVLTITPWLIAGNKGLYSEYLVDVSSVLMNHSGWQQSGSLDVVGLGGFAQLAGGNVVGHIVHGIGLQIEAGNTYLLFLKYRPTGQCFTWVKAWDVSSGKAVAVRNDDLHRAKENLSTVNGLPLEQITPRIQALAAAH